MEKLTMELAKELEKDMIVEYQLGEHGKKELYLITGISWKFEEKPYVLADVRRLNKKLGYFRDVRYSKPKAFTKHCFVKIIKRGVEW